MTGLDIEGVRAEIDALDRQIVELIARRQPWVVAAGALKPDRDAVRAPDRVEKVIDKVRALAEDADASPDVVERTYRAMIAAFIDLELSVHESHVDRDLRADGLVNGRDLGGLERSDGSLTPRGVFFRSENIDGLTAAGWSQLFDAGIRTVVDLRQQEERDLDVAERPDWLTTIHVDLDGLDNTEFWDDNSDNGPAGTALYYLPHLTAMPERAGAALASIVSAAHGGVLFHCMEGRDRTGIIATLLLLAADVDREAIVDDYLETVRRGELRANRLGIKNAEPELNDLCVRHGTTTEGAFRAALAGIDLVGFLESAGLGEADRTALMTWRGSVAARASSRVRRERNALPE